MISTKDLAKEGTGGKNAKTISPGKWTVKINSVELVAPVYDKNAYHLVYNVEGPDMGPEFEGFYIDGKNQTGPRYKGQIGRVKSGYYAFNNATLPNGTEIKRDQSILKAVYFCCVATNNTSWLEDVDGKFNTIEELVKAFSKVISGTWVKMIVGGKEYTNKQGYTNYDLFLPKNNKDSYVMELSDAQPSKLMEFNATEHIIKQKTEKVESFGDDNPFNDSSSDSLDFEL
jgi:hypothetical protein